MEDIENTVKQVLQEAIQSAESKLKSHIDDHVTNSEFSPFQGLDFLQVKNSVMITYLIELTYEMRRKLKGMPKNDDSMHRLIVMKTILDKQRGLEKKLRYQIDRLMAAGNSSTTFVTSNLEDPLQFRPDTSIVQNENFDEGENGKSVSALGAPAEHSFVGNGSCSDQEIETSRANNVTTGRTGRKKLSSQSIDSEDHHEESAGKAGGLYRAPRLTAVPYDLDRTDREAERQKKRLQRMRVSELAQTLRAQYSEAPEQEDMHGGSDMGKQREASRRFAQQQEEKTNYEENAMVRLSATRKEKKQRRKMMREELSNLAAIADLGNIVRDATFGKREGDNVEASLEGLTPEQGLYQEGNKRRRRRHS